MAETVEGSFPFTVLDEKENLYFVKEQSTLFVSSQTSVYLYTSAEAIY